MKKIYILAAIALVAGVSCTKQVPADNNSPDMPISFSPISQKIGTKAAHYGEQNETYSGDALETKYESFNVWSIFNQTAITTPGQTGTQVFFAGIVANPNNGATSTPDYWSLATPYYWPKAGYLSFHAFSPSEATGLTLTHAWGAGFTAEYVVPDDVATHVDLLYSNYEYNKQRTDYTASFPYDETGDDDSVYGYDGVNIMFNHALSSIQFYVKQNDTYSGHTLTVKKIEILNPYTTGTFHENRANTNLSNGYDVLTATQPTGTERIINVWNASATNAPYWDVNTSTEGGPYVAYNNTTGIVTTTTAQLARTNYVLAMPQSLAHTTTSNNVKIKITYDYTFGSQTLTNQIATIDISGLAGSDSVETGDRTVDKWLINHRYIYTINFKLDEIIFDPAVTSFIDVTATVDVPASTVS